MHYNSWAFAIDRSRPTIVPVDSQGLLRTGVYIGQRTGLSDGDKRTIATMYNLQLNPQKATKSPSPLSPNGGSGSNKTLSTIAVIALVVSLCALVVVAVVFAARNVIMRRRRELEVCTPESRSYVVAATFQQTGHHDASDRQFCRQKHGCSPVRSLDLMPIQDCGIV